MTSSEERALAVIAYMRANPTVDGWFRLRDLQGWRGSEQTSGRQGVIARGSFLSRAAIRTALGHLEDDGLVEGRPGTGPWRLWRLAEDGDPSV